MIVMKQVLQPVQNKKHNLSDYKEIYENFDWNEITFKDTDKINGAYEAIGRHVDEGYGEKKALYFVEGGETKAQLTFKEVQDEIDKYVQVFREEGAVKGDRIYIFLPKNIANYTAMLAAIRIGAIAVPLFEGFYGDAVHDRIKDSEGKIIITDDDLGQRIDYDQVPSIETVLYQSEIETRDLEGDDYIEWVTPEDNMLLHYTSGSTGKPKGVLHAHRIIAHHKVSGKWVLDIQEDDVYWCTSHPGWVTGSVYGLLAPWVNRATIVIQSGRFKAEDWYSLIEELNVSIWYSAPTAFRMLMAKGDLYKDYDLSSLRHILSVGEPLNPEVIYWAQNNLGVRIHDTWWMTETGGHLIVNLPSEPIKPGSMGRAFPGIQIGILNEKGEEVPDGVVGQLSVKTPWPGLMKTVWNNQEKYEEYFKYPGWYISGDLAMKDEEEYIFFKGRNYDMINSSGERIGPFEVESTLIEHPAVSEAGVIGKPDKIRGEIVKAFITLNDGYEESEELVKEISQFVRTKLAAHSAPREIEVVKDLPKTTISGKILRRQLKQEELTRLENEENLIK